MANTSGFGYRGSDFDLTLATWGFTTLGAGIVFGLAHIAHGAVFGISHTALIFFVGAGFFAAAARTSTVFWTADIAQAAGFGARGSGLDFISTARGFGSL